MKNIKLFALLILTLGLLTNFAMAKGKQENFKVLLQGNQSEIEQPFIFIARNVESYKQLKTIVKDLPEDSTVDFEKFAVVAGFAGIRSTGGYAVEIKNVLNKVAIDVLKPKKGMMVTQMITSPFKIVLVPISGNANLQISPSKEFMSKMEVYNVSSGDFGFTGGIAGIRKNFKADGKINVWTSGSFVTLAFDLKSTEKENKRKLNAVASGTLNDKQIDLARLDAGTFSDFPRPPFLVKGTLFDSKLNLTFSPLPLDHVSDGYAGYGSLAANK